jgi:hypothetical protein
MKCELRNARCENGARATAFTLMEVMIACGIFFMAVFAILALVSNTLRNAQRLRRVEVDAGIVCAQLFRTNRLTEGIESGDLTDFGYPDYTWQTEAHEHELFTNGLWQVEIILRKHGVHEPIDSRSIWIYSPDSSQGRFGQGMRR